jgi:hypothetical protein
MFRSAMVKWGLVGVGLAALLLVGFSEEGLSWPPGRGEQTTVSGTVKEFTTAPRGEVDGLVLNDGTVIHWPPHLADRLTGIVKKGDRVEATGRKERNPEGVEQVEVKTLTNLRTKASRANDDAPPPPPRGPKGPKGKEGPQEGPAGKSTERRLRALEQKVDRLVEEVKRLSKDK